MDKNSTDIQLDKSFLTNNAAYWIEIDRRVNNQEISDEDLEDSLGYGDETIIRILSEARNKTGR
jgi:hypothetical protein